MTASRSGLVDRWSETCRKTRSLVGEWIGFPVENLLPSIGQHRLLRSMSRSGAGGLEEWERRGRALGTKGAAGGGSAGFLVVEPKNAWAGERVKPGRRVELESVEKSKSGTF